MLLSQSHQFLSVRTVNTFSTALSNAGYPVYYSDTYYMQVELSACSGKNGQWKLAAVSNFGSTC